MKMTCEHLDGLGPFCVGCISKLQADRDRLFAALQPFANCFNEPEKASRHITLHHLRMAHEACYPKEKELVRWPHDGDGREA